MNERNKHAACLRGGRPRLVHTHTALSSPCSWHAHRTHTPPFFFFLDRGTVRLSCFFLHAARPAAGQVRVWEGRCRAGATRPRTFSSMRWATRSSGHPRRTCKCGNQPCLATPPPSRAAPPLTNSRRAPPSFSHPHPHLRRAPPGLAAHPGRQPRQVKPAAAPPGDEAGPAATVRVPRRLCRRRPPGRRHLPPVAASRDRMLVPSMPDPRCPTPRFQCPLREPHCLVYREPRGVSRSPQTLSEVQSLRE